MDIVNVIADIKKITGISDSTEQKQQSLNVSDVWRLWDTLVAKYDTIEVINILLNCARDADLKSVVKGTLKVVEKGVNELQQLCWNTRFPFPQGRHRPQISLLI